MSAAWFTSSMRMLTGLVCFAVSPRGDSLLLISISEVSLTLFLEQLDSLDVLQLSREIAYMIDEIVLHEIPTHLYTLQLDVAVA